MQASLDRIVALSAQRPLPGLIWAMRANASGAATEIAPGSPLEPITEGWYWLHFGLSDNRTHALMEALAGGPAANLMKAQEELQEINFQGDIAYGTIADLQRDIDGTRDHSGFMHFIAGGNLLITARRNSLHGAGAARRLLQQGAEIHSVEALLENIIIQAVEGFDRRVEQIADDVDRLEDRIIAGIVGDARANLGTSRRTVVRIHRHLSGLRTMLLRLGRDGGKAAPAAYLSMASRICQHSDQLDHDILGLRERSRLLQEEVAAMLAEETNKHLRVLSILTILFIPPTFIGGLFGMNLKGIPFAEGAHGFWGACLLAAVFSAVVAGLLRRSGILGRRDYH